MSWVDYLNKNLRKAVNRGNPAVLESRSGIKADENLEHLADLAENILQGKLEKVVRLYTKKIFYFRKTEALQMIHLTYHLENRLLSKTYDLQIEGQAEGFLEKGMEHTEIIFQQRSLKNKKPCFTGGAKDAVLEGKIQKLNDPLILNRIEKLDLSELYITYSESKNCWKISSRSIIGSSVSLMFPPLTRGIAMQPQEIVLLYELYSMIAAALKNGQSQL